MPNAIISPSVLASDFGQLTAECKRMIKGGAEWLHMGQYRHPMRRRTSTHGCAQMLWMGNVTLCASYIRVLDNLW